MTISIYSNTRSLLLSAGAAALLMFSTATTTAAASLISSVQDVDVSLSGTGLTATANFSSVTTSRTTLFYGGYSTDLSSGSGDAHRHYITLTDATTITLTRNTGTSGAIDAKACVVEWASGVTDSVQYGTVTLTGVTSNTAAISSVTTTDSAITYLGNSASNSSQQYQRHFCSAHISSATQITSTRGDATGNCTTSFCVTEFASGKLNQNTEQFTITIASTTTSNTATVTTATEGQTLCAWGGHYNTSGNANWAKFGYLQQTSNTQFTATRHDSTNTSSHYGTVVCFKSTDVTGRDEGVGTVAAGGTTKDDTIGAVVTNKAIVSFLGWSADTNTTAPECATSVKLTSTTNVRTTRNTLDASLLAYAGYQVMELV